MGDFIRVIGLDQLGKKLTKNLDINKVKKIVRVNGSEMQQKAQRLVPVDTGTLKRSITLEITDGGMAAEVEPHTEYAAYVEYGTRKMAAQPYIKPAFEEQSKQFEKDMRGLVK